MDSLWPKIEGTTAKAPVAILKEQASLLGRQTQNLVMAEVVTGKIRNTKLGAPIGLEAAVEQVNKFFHSDRIGAATSDVFRHSFELVAPALNHYRYELFSIFYGIDFYPITFILDGDIANEIITAENENILARSEDEFVDVLKAIFNSEKTQRVIRAILTQSQALAEPA